MRRPVRVAAGLVAGLLALAACGGERNNDAANNGNGGRLAIATGNTTGVYYVLGGGYAQVINKNLPGYRATAEATGASVENVERVVSGQSDIAFCLADTAFDAVSGQGSFTSKQPVRALARIYSNHTHVIVRADSGINKIEDMKGKTISTGSPKSGTEVIALRLLRSAGLDPEKDVKRQKLALAETVDGIEAGRIQGLVWSGGLPTPDIKRLFADMNDKVKFLDLSPYLMGMQTKFSPLYTADTIAKSVYNTPADVKSIAVPNVLLVRDTMSDDLAEKLTALLFEHQQDLAAVHPEAKNYDIKTAQETGGIPLHPGATRYYSQHKSG
jgi:TRAP transporter TAXI family solute receptor